ncbi:MAG: sigma-70 family RNA polymerase sigma factor, partial [Blastocatellia bacterium]
VATNIMRHILIDIARKSSRKRETEQISDPTELTITAERAAELIALDDALSALAELDTRQSRIVELRFFGGLTVEETAEMLGISPRQVMRDWNAAKAWLYHELSKEQR